MSVPRDRQSSEALLFYRSHLVPEWKGFLLYRREDSNYEQRGWIRTACSDSRVQGAALAPRMKLSQCSIHSWDLASTRSQFISSFGIFRLRNHWGSLSRGMSLRAGIL